MSRNGFVAGIDIGTTTISLVLLGEGGELLGSRTLEHGFLPGAGPDERLQDPEEIFALAEKGLRELCEPHGGLCALGAIGMTGQMHGMLYHDREGRALSPLFTWQDGRGDRLLPEGYSSTQFLKETIGGVSTGYALSTHLYLQRTGAVPEGAAGMATISDYVAMRLCRIRSVPVSADMGASWGCFDGKRKDFRHQELRAAGVNIRLLPGVSLGHGPVGTTPEGVPVMLSMGDNQASVIGSVQDLSSSVLLNIGTGSQISMACPGYVPAEGSIELRPLTEHYNLLAGSGLCGGRAYAMLESFYRSVPGNEGRDQGSLYAQMESQAERFLAEQGREAAWQIRPTFSGTRDDPAQLGLVKGLSVSNFTPGALTAGMLLGILGELKSYYDQMCRLSRREASLLVGSGNGIRKNPLMRSLAEEMFGLKLSIPAWEEEAACGAALSAMAETGLCSSLAEAQGKIRYL